MYRTMGYNTYLVCYHRQRNWKVYILRPNLECFYIICVEKNNIATSLLLYMHFIFIVKKKKYHKC